MMVYGHRFEEELTFQEGTEEAAGRSSFLPEVLLKSLSRANGLASLIRHYSWIRD